VRRGARGGYARSFDPRVFSILNPVNTFKRINVNAGTLRL
jgi:hypothetical protein